MAGAGMIEPQSAAEIGQSVLVWLHAHCLDA